MKILKYIFPLMAVFAAVSCSEDEYTPGESDVTDSYDVYFDGGQSAKIEYGIKDKKFEYEITASRNNTQDAITVPITIKGDNSVAFATPLEFAAGQASAKFKVVFSDLELQKPYEFVISIDDPKYALIYGLEETTVTLSIIKVDYVKVKNGIYSSKMLSGTFRVELEKSEILGKYRLTKTWDGRGEPIVFTWDGSSEEVIIEKGTMFATGLAARVDQAGNTAAIYAEYLDAMYSKKDDSLYFLFDYVVPDVGGSVGQSQDIVKF